MSIAVLALLVMFGSSSDDTEATSFNTTSASLIQHTSNELCNSSTDVAAAHELGFPVSSHNKCADVPTAGGAPGLRTRSEFEDGSVIATSLTYTSGLINTPPSVGGSGGGFDVTVGDIMADIDLFCDGAADRLNLSAISKAVNPNFTAVVDAGPNTSAGNYVETGFNKNLIRQISLGGAADINLPNPVTLGFTVYRPDWTGVAADTRATLAVVGGDPNPPTLPLCTQGPQRATTNSPGTCPDPDGVGPITACGYNPYTNPATGRILTWSLYIGGADYYDGLEQFGPVGGNSEATGFGAIPAGVLNNVQCLEVDGAPNCPANDASAGTPACSDGGLWEDTDSDGLPDLVEVAWGSDCTKIDSDTLCHGSAVGGPYVGEGLTDFEEMALMSNPLDIDTDGDGACASGARSDSADNCVNKSQGAAQTDTDNDGGGDACDIDDDQDGIIDEAETNGIYMGYVNDVNPDPVAALGGLQCRPWAEISAGTSYSVSAAEAADLKITLNPLVADDDGDGIFSGSECSLGSSPDDDSGSTGGGGTASMDGVCLGTTDGTGAACTISAKFIGPVGVLKVISTSAATSRPELQDGGAADDDGDGNANNQVDPDADGLPASHERSERTICVRIATGSYGKPQFSTCADATYPGVFNNNFDGDAFGGGASDTDPNSDCNIGWAAPNDCAGTQVCAWTAASGYNTTPLTAVGGPLSTDATGGAGCDGPELWVQRGQAGTNEDGDGQSRVKSTAASPHGANRVTGYGGAGLGGCSSEEEAANGTNNAYPRDFFDVNNSGKVDAVDVGLVRGAFNAVSGLSALYKRSLDLNNSGPPANAAGGHGSGKIDAVDVGLVRGQFNKTCIFTP